MKRFTLLALVLAACGSVPAYGGASVTPLVSWVQEYANPFDPNFTRGVASDVVIDYIDKDLLTSWREPGNYPLQLAVNRRSGRGVVGRLMNPDGATGDMTWATFQTLNRQFQVGTVIAAQSVYGAAASMSYSVKLGNSADAANYATTADYWDSVASTLSGQGTPSTYAVNVKTLDRVGTYDTLRMDVKAVWEPGAAWRAALADYGQVVVLPDRLDPISRVTATASAATWGSGTNLVDGNCSTGWVYAKASDSTAATNPKYVTIDFVFALEPGELQKKVDAIVIWSFENTPSAFTIRDGAGRALADVTMTAGTSGVLGWVLPIEFTRSLNTDKITFDFGMAENVGLCEVMFLTKLPPVPEPATMSLLALGGLALLRRRGR